MLNHNNFKTPILLLLIAMIGTLSVSTFAQEDQSSPSYNARLEGYEYPFPVKMYSFESQNQTLEMAYMYLPPQGNNPVAVLFHGKNFSGAYWETTADLLQSHGIGVLMPDQIGFGKSSKPEHYQFSFPQFVNNTQGLMDELDIKNPIIVGHSMGGMLATRYALMNPETTQQLILINPIGLEDYLDYVQYKDPSFFYQNEVNKTAEDVKAYQQKFYYDGKWKADYDPWVQMHAGWINGPDWEKVAWNNALTYDMIFSEPVANEFTQLRVPTTLIIGTRDRTGPGRGWKKEGVTYELGQYQILGKLAAAQIPNSTLYELEGLGHMPQIEDFDAFKKVFEKAIN